jgi:hypothetical protein
MTDVISGIKIPDSKIAREAAELVRQHENEMLFNHSVRVFVFGAMKGIRQNLKFESELLYVAALFHDLGLIALHTTRGIPQYMRPEIALTNAGVVMDVVGIGYDEYTPEQRDRVITAFPRGDFKNEFIEVQTCAALKKPETTFGTINFDYIEHRDPTFRKPNVCAFIHNNPWRS